MKLLSILIMLILAGIAYDTFYVKNNNTMPSQIAIAPIVDEIIAIGVNLPEGDTITPNDLETGKYPLLAVRVANNEYILNVINRMGPLWTFDRHQDGVINSLDPVYDNLAFAYINPSTKTVRFVPVKAEGLQAIILDPSHRLKEEKPELGLPSGYWQAHSQFVMSDNSKWLTFHVPLPTSFLDSLSVEPGSNQKIIPAGR